MRKQSWQVRLIPLFYSAGIIKGLSNNNYAPKVDTPLSCSRCEWQRGVCATERKSTSRRGGGKGAGVCKCAWRCVRTHAWEVEKGEVKLAVNSKTQVFQKQAHTSLISPQHMAVNSKQKNKSSPAPLATPTRGNPPHGTSGNLGWESGEQETPNCRVSAGVESIESHPSVELTGDEVMCGDTGALPRICRSLIDLTLEITDKDAACYRSVCLTTAFPGYCATCWKCKLYCKLY